jgi:hypothetical protein
MLALGVHGVEPVAQLVVVAGKWNYTVVPAVA